jgi:hypothetical protein
LLRRLLKARRAPRCRAIVVAKQRLFEATSGRGNCYDNAMVETVFNTIK